ncbi:hypothetical protein BP5796_05517 [Coleophoma crateriformis]|uniref:Uncharacterized protein n=1 Tax=Coleophoma crateriformis TaxID=565419 RepID=A0A3D8S3F5_9HELO|nr:hypothetical protein BP5796_05517 [Coleophoma crateriformis]
MTPSSQASSGSTPRLAPFTRASSASQGPYYAATAPGRAGWDQQARQGARSLLRHGGSVGASATDRGRGFLPEPARACEEEDRAEPVDECEGGAA